MSQDQQDAAEHIEELLGRISALSQKCCIRSEMRLAREMQRVARTERLVVPYLRALFSLTNGAQSTYEADLGVEWAIEAIALLEERGAGPAVQSNLPEQEYYRTVYWMSACAYDNLATHAANRDGYNSDGVHQTINDGIHVCRRTGKLECVNCFREYAARVCLAAATLPSPRTMRRPWPRQFLATPRTTAVSAGRTTWRSSPCSTAGRPTPWRPCPRRFDFPPRTTLPRSPSCAPRDNWSKRCWSADIHGELDALLARGLGGRHLPEAPPEGEDTQLDLHRSNCRTLSACCAGDYEQAIDALRQWDRRMQTLNNVNRWFDVRLRLIAACRLAGKTGHVEALARQLEARAKRRATGLRWPVSSGCSATMRFAVGAAQAAAGRAVRARRDCAGCQGRSACGKRPGCARGGSRPGGGCRPCNTAGADARRPERPRSRCGNPGRAIRPTARRDHEHQG